MRELSVFLVDHNPLFAQLLTRFLQSEEHVQVSSLSSSNENIIHHVQHTQPDVILIDLDRSVSGSLELIAGIRAILPESLIIALTLLDTVYYRKAVVDSGADDLIYKMELGANFLIDLHARLAKRRRGLIKNFHAFWPRRIIPIP